MTTVNVSLKENSYKIVIGRGILPRLGAALKTMKIGTDVVVITSPVIRRHHGNALIAGLKRHGFSVTFFEVPEGEQSKSAKVAFPLMERIARHDAMKGLFIIAFGGGVVGDLAGYVAASYKRGVPYVQVPTTFLAQIDSAIGGKVAIDLPIGKNLIGAFHQPRAVIADLSRIASLKKRQVVNGLVEALKKFLTSEKRSLPLIEKLDLAHPLRRPGVLQQIAYRSVFLKARVVGKDEEEKNERRILNFGHTIGHALEFVSRYTLPHGFAVGYGMLVEARVSEHLGLLSRQERERLERYLADLGITASLIKKYPISKVLEAAKGDKKARRGEPHYVLLTSLGSVYTKGGQYAHPVPERTVRKAYEEVV